MWCRTVIPKDAPTLVVPPLHPEEIAHLRFTRSRVVTPLVEDLEVHAFFWANLLTVVALRRELLQRMVLCFTPERPVRKLQTSSEEHLSIVVTMPTGAGVTPVHTQVGIGAYFSDEAGGNHPLWYPTLPLC